ncbi:hypothetical protein PVAP13_3NG175700 [Panicum virgatum]|uniref:Uncharacterized protein n=1 Tax=Panicum virgatum TaxID=38727 RepID=A0A8T0UGI0_PANVG|nr:hypothetical protein PVAP13_3NG175700 [Panicum virgatum]
MSRLPGDPHPRTRKPSTGFTSAAARLLLRHSQTEAANGESIEFFSALRKCLPDPHISGQNALAARGAAQPADVKGKARRGSSGGNTDEVLPLSSGIGKHDYDWLLTPPGTPFWSPAASFSSSGHLQVSAAVLSRLAKAGSSSHGKSNSRLDPTGLEKERPMRSRLSNCSSATLTNNVLPSGRLLSVRTASASSINTNATSNASVSSTPVRSAGSSPRTPGTARSPAATAIAHTRRRRDIARVATSYVAVQVQSGASSKTKPGAPAPTCTRAHPTRCVSSPRSTASTSRQPSSLSRRGDVAVARSRLASQSSGTGSTPQPRDAHPTSRGASGVALSSNAVKSRQVAPPVKQGGAAAASTTTQRWQHSLAPAIAAARNVRRENSLHNASPIYSASRKVNDEKTRPHRTAAAAIGSGLTRTGSRKSESTTIVKRTVNNQNEDCRRQDARHGGADAPGLRNPAHHQETRRSVTSRSRLGLMAATSTSGSISSGNQDAAPAATMAKVSRPDAFPSTRYDAMLLREDPKNLTWLRGCDEGDDGCFGGLDLVDSSLEPFDVATG